MNKKYSIVKAQISSEVTLTFALKRNIDPNLFYQVFFKNLYPLHGYTDSSRFIFLRVTFSLISHSCETLYFSMILTPIVFFFSCLSRIKTDYPAFLLLAMFYF